jgi:nucleotide-binding universal stress UspA family protein
MGATMNENDISNRIATQGFRVVVPYDGSEVAKQALVYAARLPLNFLTLLHVVPKSPYIVPELTPSERETWASEISPELEALAEPMRQSGHDVRIVIRFGDVAEEIVLSGMEHDLIVMTTSGKGAAGRLIFGNIADRVSRSARTPALLIRAGLATTSVPPMARILVPLDGSDLSEEALPVAVVLGKGTSVPIHLARVVDLDHVLAAIRRTRKHPMTAVAPVEPGEEPYEIAAKTASDEAATYLEAHAARLRQDGLRVETHVLQGSPVFSLLDAIASDDLVVMTSHGLSGYKRWLIGSVAEKLVREAKSPVVLVPTRTTAAPR